MKVMKNCFEISLTVIKVDNFIINASNSKVKPDLDLPKVFLPVRPPCASHFVLGTF